MIDTSSPYRNAPADPGAMPRERARVVLARAMPAIPWKGCLPR